MPSRQARSWIRNPHRPTGRNYTPAARDGRLDDVRRLLEQGADPNAREGGDNTYPLHWAAAARHVEVARCSSMPVAMFTVSATVHRWTLNRLEPPSSTRTTSRPASSRRVHAKLGGAARRAWRAPSHLFRDVASVTSISSGRSWPPIPRALAAAMSTFEHGLTPIHFAISRSATTSVDTAARARSGSGGVQPARSSRARDGDAARRSRGHGGMRARCRRGQPPGDPARAQRARWQGLAGSTRKIVPMIAGARHRRGAALGICRFEFKSSHVLARTALLNFAMVSFRQCRGDAEHAPGSPGGTT